MVPLLRGSRAGGGPGWGEGLIHGTRGVREALRAAPRRPDPFTNPVRCAAGARGPGVSLTGAWPGPGAAAPENVSFRRATGRLALGRQQKPGRGAPGLAPLSLPLFLPRAAHSYRRQMLPVRTDRREGHSTNTEILPFARGPGAPSRGRPTRSGSFFSGPAFPSRNSRTCPGQTRLHLVKGSQNPTVRAAPFGGPCVASSFSPQSTMTGQLPRGARGGGQAQPRPVSQSRRPWGASARHEGPGTPSTPRPALGRLYQRLWSSPVR